MKIFKNLLKLYEIGDEDQSLLQKIKILEDKYDSLLKDVVRLEEENVETTNLLYELSNSIDAVDYRIDILAEQCGCIKNV